MATAVLQLGFRPFFLLGASHAFLVIGAWVGYLQGWLPRLGAFDPVLWHAHEMVYGFASAIIGGFVLTAIQNWTGIPGVKGRPLALLALLWISARVLLAIPGAPLGLAAALDLAFYPALGLLLYPYFKDPELKVERVFYLFFSLFFAGNLLMHLHAMGFLTRGRQGALLGLDTVLALIVFIGGRVIPFFTESSVARAQPRTRETVEIGCHVSMAAFLVADFLFQGSLVLAVAAFAAAALHLARLLGWQVRRLRRIPLIWVLHLGYLWLVIGFALSGLSALGWVAPGVAIHAFTVGGIGVIIHGMISRVTLGHTGRRLHPSAWSVVGFVLLNLSAVFRVFGPVLAPREALGTMLVIAAGLWMAGFALFLAVQGPMLLAPRVDGRPG
ncbi:MAG: NnrS family protein [Oligoflexia bacterium]|nr:NnrS family protein [Oligoflexia bacterium]